MCPASPAATPFSEQSPLVVLQGPFPLLLDGQALEIPFPTNPFLEASELNSWILDQASLFTRLHQALNTRSARSTAALSLNPNTPQLLGLPCAGVVGEGPWAGLLAGGFGLRVGVFQGLGLGLEGGWYGNEGQPFCLCISLCAGVFVRARGTGPW